MKQPFHMLKGEIMKDTEHICIYCSKSFVTEDDKLYCTLREEIVNDEDACEE